MPRATAEKRIIEKGTLAAGGVAAILASTCCLGPLVLVALGFSGAWIGNLTTLEPYRPIFLGSALVALYFAWGCHAIGRRLVYGTRALHIESIGAP
jgi:MerT mercuric transport protein